jgi:hypothetical protein
MAALMCGLTLTGLVTFALLNAGRAPRENND